MKRFNLHFMGRFGNCVMSYLFARAFCEKNGLELHIDKWIGEDIFEISHPRCTGELPRRDEYTIKDDDADISFRSYCQQQKCIVYSKRDAQRWLQIRPEIKIACANAVLVDDRLNDRVVCHVRRGDYEALGYPVVSRQSYKLACERFGLLWSSPHVSILTEEDPTPHSGFLPDELGFIVDFYRMMAAPTLLRGNSSFSWVAALLGNGLVLSPVIDGLEGGKEHDCLFVPGNHPRFANFDFVTDLFVAP